jgi:hypothetical protein
MVLMLFLTLLILKFFLTLTTSKIQSTETLRTHLLGVANWVLFILRTRSAASAPLAGKSGATPGPVEMEDTRDNDEPLASW